MSAGHAQRPVAKNTHSVGRRPQTASEERSESLGVSAVLIRTNGRTLASVLVEADRDSERMALRRIMQRSVDGVPQDSTDGRASPPWSVSTSRLRRSERQPPQVRPQKQRTRRAEWGPPVSRRTSVPVTEPPGWLCKAHVFPAPNEELTRTSRGRRSTESDLWPGRPPARRRWDACGNPMSERSKPWGSFGGGGDDGRRRLRRDGLN